MTSTKMTLRQLRKLGSLIAISIWRIMSKEVKTNWRIKFKSYYATPEKERLLNKHLRLVVAENPSAFREELFVELEKSLNTRSIDN